MMTKTEDTNLASMIAGAMCALLLAVASTGCIGDIDDTEDPVDTSGDTGDGDGDSTPTPGDGDGGDPLPPPPPDALTVSGMAMDYAEATNPTPVTIPVELATVETLGMTPLLSAVTDDTGAYTLTQVAPNSVVNATITPPGVTWRATVNATNIVAVESPTEINFHAVDVGYARDNTINVTGLDPLPLTSVVFGELLRPDGTPMSGVPLENVTLTDALGAPVGAGPYFIDPAVNRLDPLLLESPLLDARVGFVNVPSGEYTLSVIDPGLLPEDPADDIAYILPITTIDDGATLTVVGDLAVDPGTPPPPPPGENLTFTADVYPLLQRAIAGGDGCASCHTLNGPAQNNIQMDLGAEIVLNAMLNRLGTINLDVPEESTLLTMPLYEVPANHPNATYATPNDPNYQIILAWIAQGAPL